jgi:formamidopyrimidine-DNA glycosylase
MPELPEVETVARQLAPQVTGRTLRSLRIVDPLLRRGSVPVVAGRAVRDVKRSGKRLLFELSPRRGRHDPLWLAVHLRMTGRLLWRRNEEPTARPRHRARFSMDGGELLFTDTRRFGTFDWYRQAEDAAPEGVEPLSDEFTVARLVDLLGKSSQELKPWLLRQDRIVGLGNIYASEILHRARLSPFRPAGSLTRGEARRLRNATRRILERAIASCGTTFSDFQDARGVEGSYQQFLAVYDGAGEPCRRCRSPIVRVVQQQRSTFHCPVCQE